MQYRKFGNENWEVSLLGFGAMRLPCTSGSENGKIDEKQTEKMLMTSIDCGVNYVDTAYIYHGGKSETVVGNILKKGYRQKVKLATKIPLWLVNKPEDYDKFLDEQLKRLQTDHIDYYLFHSFGQDTWDNTVKLDLFKKAEDAKKAGKIGHICFSFHDDYPVFEKIINGYDGWEMCQIQYNYMDTENQAGTKGLKLAASRGIPVVVMEPLLGGKLTKPPKDIEAMYSSSKRSPAELALQWLWDQPEVTTVLSGMSNQEQVEQNLKSAETARPLTKEEMDMISRIKASYLGRATIPCTKCGYCMPCPNNVDIPENFSLYNESVIYDALDALRFQYSHFFDEGSHADKCIGCRVCEENCPQKIQISEWMPKVAETLG